MSKNGGLKMRGAQGFEEFYARVYDARWSDLRHALRGPGRRVSLLNPFAESQPSQAAATSWSVAGWKWPVRIIEETPLPSTPSGLLPWYNLDVASIACALALPVALEKNWLDFCAAPGGKTLVKLFAANGALITTANEYSKVRVKRLKAVLHDYLPASVLERVRVTSRDGLRWVGKGEFSSVLLDAPCSGERHLLESPTELAKWSARRSEHLSVRQHALLCRALELVAVGGSILYSTCSISPLENDQVIAKLLKKRADRVRVETAPLWLGERTEFGVSILPDRAQGAGPIYYSLLRRL